MSEIPGVPKGMKVARINLAGNMPPDLRRWVAELVPDNIYDRPLDEVVADIRKAGHEPLMEGGDVVLRTPRLDEEFWNGKRGVRQVGYAEGQYIILAPKAKKRYLVGRFEIDHDGMVLVNLGLVHGTQIRETAARLLLQPGWSIVEESE